MLHLTSLLVYHFASDTQLANIIIGTQTTRAQDKIEPTGLVEIILFILEL